MRISRLCRGLPQYGINPVVLTVKNPLVEGTDDSISFASGTRVERAGMLLTPVDLYRRWRTTVKGTQTPSSSATNSISRPRAPFRRHLLSLLQIPDIHWGWYWPATLAAKRLVKRELFSAILSSGPPWTCHLIARYIKEKYHLPWIADFRDAWTQDPFRYEEEGGTPGWRKGLDRRLESSCLRFADLIVSTTDAIREGFVAANPAIPSSKFVTLTNGVDDTVRYPTSTKHLGARRLILHLGSLYGGRRRIDTFCQAITDLVSAGRLDPASFKVLFLGVEEPVSDIKGIAEGIAPELVKSGSLEFLPRVSWLDGQKILMEADTLLIFAGDNTLIVPAKFFEYLPTGKPIFAVVEKGALTEIVESTASGLWVEPGNSAKIAEKILQILQWSPRSPEAIEPLIRQYQPKVLAERLAGWITTLVVERGSLNQSAAPSTARLD